MDESRKQFEEWVKFHLGDDWSEVSMHTANGGANYKDSYVDLAWIAWEASRAAIEIELRKPNQGSLPGDYHIGYDSGAESQYESDVDAIRAAGIKVKE
ncbi:Phage protein [Enterobacter asburiae]